MTLTNRRELWFSKCLHLRNPWNDNKEVKICRDGQVTPCALWFDTLNRQFIIIYTVIFKSFNNSSSGVNLNPYSVFFLRSYFNSKKEFKELFFRGKSHPRFGVTIEELK